MPGHDISSPGFVVSVLTNTNELRLTGRSDPQVLAKALDGMVDVTERVLSFTYEDSERDLDVLKLRVDNHDLYFLEHPAWVKGNLVKFAFGYPTRMFGVRPSRFAVVDSMKGFKELTITCIEEAALANAAETRLFKNKTRLDVIRQMINEGRFPGVRIIQTDITLLEGEVFKRDWQQARQTDLQFLYRLAEPIGFEAYIEGNILFFLPRRIGSAPARKFTYFHGDGDLLDFNVTEWGVTSRPAQTVSRGRDPFERVNREGCGSDSTTRRDTLGNQSSSNLSPVKRPGSGNVPSGASQAGGVSGILGGRSVNTSPNFSQADLTNEANGRFRRQEQNEVKATATIVGDPLLKAKTVIEIDGISSQLSGKWYIESHTHSLAGGSSGYTGKLKLLKNALAKIPTQDPPSLDPSKANENTKKVQNRRARVIQVSPTDGRVRAVPMEET